MHGKRNRPFLFYSSRILTDVPAVIVVVVVDDGRWCYLSDPGFHVSTLVQPDIKVRPLHIYTVHPGGQTRD